VLVENFSWPWLYEPLLEEAPELAPLSGELDLWSGRATLHLLAEPYCWADPRAHAAVLPVSRPPRRAREELRGELGVGGADRLVVLTMGGYAEAMPFLHRLEEMRDVTFVVTGAPASEVRGNLRLHDNASRLYMPDLVRAADAVVAKLGYSTVAEVWREGRAAAFVTRADFREMRPLWAWVSERIPGFEIPGTSFAAGEWVERIPELLGMIPPPAQPRGGADQVVDHMMERIPSLAPGRRPARPS
jgi:hypothetical protein